MRTRVHVQQDHGTILLHRHVIACALGLALAGLSVGMLVTPLHTGHDTRQMMLVTQNLLTKASFQVSPDGTYSDYGLGMSLVFIPLYLLGSLLRQDVIGWMLLSSSVLFALTLAATFWLAMGCGATRRQGVVTSLLVGFGTLLVAYVPTGLSELGVGLCIAVGLAGLTAVPRNPRRAGALVGAAAGLAALMRVDSLLLVVPILGAGAWLRGGRRRLALLAFVGGAAPGLLAVAAYNMLRFGAPWRLGYADTAVFNHSLLAGLYGLLLSPGAGLVWYVPLVLVAMVGFPQALRRFPTLTVVALALILIRIPVYGTFWAWTGGPGVWGPRYLAPAMPALALGVLEVVRGFWMLPSAVRVGVIAVATVSVLVQLPGTLVSSSATRLTAATVSVVRPLPRFSDWTRPDIVARGDDYVFNWGYFPIAEETDELLHGQDVASRFFSDVWVEPGASGPATAPGKGAQADTVAIMLLTSLFFIGLGFAWLMSREARQRRPSGPADALTDRLMR